MSDDGTFPISGRTLVVANKGGQNQNYDARIQPALRWTLGCLVGAATVVGTLILALLIALALEPPAWVQVIVGIALVGGGAALAWLVATALGRRHRGD